MEPFDAHDSRVHFIAMKLAYEAQKRWPTYLPPPTREGESMGKLTSATIKLTEQALIEWRDTCPGAGWEHHQTSALVTLCLTPSMQELLELAAIGYAVRQAETQRNAGV